MRSFRKPGDPGGTTYRAGRSSSSPLLPHRCYASRKGLEFRSRGPWPPVGGTDSHASKVTRRIRVDEKTKREVTAITVERVAEEDGNAVFDGMEWRLFVQGNASRLRRRPEPHFSGLRVAVQGGLAPDAPSFKRNPLFYRLNLTTPFRCRFP